MGKNKKHVKKQLKTKQGKKSGKKIEKPTVPLSAHDEFQSSELLESAPEIQFVFSIAAYEEENGKSNRHICEPIINTGKPVDTVTKKGPCCPNYKLIKAKSSKLRGKSKLSRNRTFSEDNPLNSLPDVKDEKWRELYANMFIDNFKIDPNFEDLDLCTNIAPISLWDIIIPIHKQSHETGSTAFETEETALKSSEILDVAQEIQFVFSVSTYEAENGKSDSPVFEPIFKTNKHLGRVAKEEPCPNYKLIRAKSPKDLTESKTSKISTCSQDFPNFIDRKCSETYFNMFTDNLITDRIPEDSCTLNMDCSPMPHPWSTSIGHSLNVPLQAFLLTNVKITNSNTLCVTNIPFTQGGVEDLRTKLRPLSLICK